MRYYSGNSLCDVVFIVGTANDRRVSGHQHEDFPSHAVCWLFLGT